MEHDNEEHTVYLGAFVGVVKVTIYIRPDCAIGSIGPSSAVTMSKF